MIGKLIGAGLGAKLGTESRKIGGTTGAILGAVAVPVVTRLRLPALLALAGGGYLASRLANKAKTDNANRTPPSA
ncbi:hypothetical protein [Aurantiacibacter poecillastricola]|uniref:hypothetical protein n=1 Tax=Aurantiacibacter poecillastricola TaxID=3064385 RepID=UPI00273EE4CB|nr:hypothetical protein [Aurantiacibacter sp. 219JJ12-13]MDP5260169.1 hypothetical protein [Aurantiacibacter sp. 219JJ12-13]